MPTTVTCPNCREPLEIPNELLGGEVRCGSCHEVFVATAAGAEPPPVPRERPRRPRREGPDVPRNKPLPRSRPAADYGPVEYDPDRKRKQGLGPALWILFGVFGLFGCGCCGLIGYLAMQVTTPEYKPFTPPDGRFTAEFPADVKEKTRDTGRGNNDKVKSFEADRIIPKETYFVYAVELKPAERKNPDLVLKELADGLMKVNQGKEVSRTDRNHDGYKAVDLTVRVGKKRSIQARLIAADDRAYVIGVAMDSEPQESIWTDDSFFENFEIVPPPDRKKDDPKPNDDKKPKPADDDDN